MFRYNFSKLENNERIIKNYPKIIQISKSHDSFQWTTPYHLHKDHIEIAYIEKGIAHYNICSYGVSNGLTGNGSPASSYLLSCNYRFRYGSVWFGVLLVMVMETGQITPPVGINAFIIAGIAKDIPLMSVFKGVAPFIIALLLAIAVIIIFPQIALWLPNLLY